MATHPGLIDSLLEFVSASPDSTLKSRYLRQLKRHQRHFEARRNAKKRPGLWLRELFNGGYLSHPQAIRSALYDIVKGD